MFGLWGIRIKEARINEVWLLINLGSSDVSPVFTNIIILPSRTLPQLGDPRHEVSHEFGHGRPWRMPLEGEWQNWMSFCHGSENLLRGWSPCLWRTGQVLTRLRGGGVTNWYTPFYFQPLLLFLRGDDALTLYGVQRKGNGLYFIDNLGCHNLTFSASEGQGSLPVQIDMKNYSVFHLFYYIAHWKYVDSVR